MITRCEHCDTPISLVADQLTVSKNSAICPRCGEWTTLNTSSIKKNLFGYRGKRQVNNGNPEAVNDY